MWWSCSLLCYWLNRVQHIRQIINMIKKKAAVGSLNTRVQILTSDVTSCEALHCLRGSGSCKGGEVKRTAVSLKVNMDNSIIHTWTPNLISPGQKIVALACPLLEATAVMNATFFAMHNPRVSMEDFMCFTFSKPLYIRHLFCCEYVQRVVLGVFSLL